MPTPITGRPSPIDLIRQAGELQAEENLRRQAEYQSAGKASPSSSEPINLKRSNIIPSRPEGVSATYQGVHINSRTGEIVRPWNQAQVNALGKEWLQTRPTYMQLVEAFGTIPASGGKIDYDRKYNPDKTGFALSVVSDNIIKDIKSDIQQGNALTGEKVAKLADKYDDRILSKTLRESGYNVSTKDIGKVKTIVKYGSLERAIASGTDRDIINLFSKSEVSNASDFVNSLTEPQQQILKKDGLQGLQTQYEQAVKTLDKTPGVKTGDDYDIAKAIDAGIEKDTIDLVFGQGAYAERKEVLNAQKKIAEYDNPVQAAIEGKIDRQTWEKADYILEGSKGSPSDSYSALESVRPINEKYDGDLAAALRAKAVSEEAVSAVYGPRELREAQEFNAGHVFDPKTGTAFAKDWYDQRPDTGTPVFNIPKVGKAPPSTVEAAMALTGADRKSTVNTLNGIFANKGIEGVDQYFQDLDQKRQETLKKYETIISYTGPESHLKRDITPPSYDINRLAQDLLKKGKNEKQVKSEIQRLGFDGTSAAGAVTYAKSDPKERFSILQKQGVIPKEAQYAGQENGQPTYFIPSATQTSFFDDKRFIDKSHNERESKEYSEYRRQTAMRLAYSEAYNSGNDAIRDDLRSVMNKGQTGKGPYGYSAPTWGITEENFNKLAPETQNLILSKAQKLEAQAKEGWKAGAMLIPGLGTYLTVKEHGWLSGWSVLSLTADAAIVAGPIARAGKGVIGVVQVPLESGGTAKVWRGLKISNIPLAGVSEGKPALGMKGITYPKAAEIAEGFEPVSKIETKVLTGQKALAKIGFTEAEMGKLESTLNTRIQFAGSKSPHLTNEIILDDIKTLSSDGVGTVFKKAIARGDDIESVYGSTTIKQQLSPELREWRKPGDIDIQTKLNDIETRKFTRDLAEELKKTEGSQRVRVSIDKPNLIEVKGKDGQWHHAVDIHSRELTPGSEMAAEGAYGIKHAEPAVTIRYPGVGKINFMTLSESGKRKAASILEWRKGEFAPPPHRTKDIADYYVILRTFKGKKVADKWARSFGYEPETLEELAKDSSSFFGWEFKPGSKAASASARISGISPQISILSPGMKSAALISPSVADAIRSASSAISVGSPKPISPKIPSASTIASISKSIPSSKTPSTISPSKSAPVRNVVSTLSSPSSAALKSVASKAVSPGSASAKPSSPSPGSPSPGSPSPASPSPGSPSPGSPSPAKTGKAKGTDDFAEIVSVEGTPENPGEVLWQQGELGGDPVWVDAKPPSPDDIKKGNRGQVEILRQAPEDAPRKKGTPKETIFKRGQAPEKMVVRVGAFDATVEKGRKILFDKAPTFMTRSGRGVVVGKERPTMRRRKRR